MGASFARLRAFATKQPERTPSSMNFRYPLRSPGQLEIAPSKACDPHHFAAALRDHGALLPDDESRCKEFVASLAKSEPAKNWTYAAETGWLDDKWQAYVEADGVIGTAPTKIIGVKRAGDVRDLTGKVSKSGTAESWTCVAERVRQSSILMLAICAAFAAPLLGALNFRSFGINIFGRSRIGKTIATLVGASVRGTGTVNDLISWGITNSRFEQRLPEFSDSDLRD